MAYTWQKHVTGYGNVMAMCYQKALVARESGDIKEWRLWSNSAAMRYQEMTACRDSKKAFP